MPFDIENATQAELTQVVYIAYFGRIAEPEGLAYWEDQAQALAVDGASNTEILANFASRFAEVAESQARFPFLDDPDADGAETFVQDIYEALFGRTAEPAGTAFYSERIVEQLTSGEPIGDIVLDIVAGAQNADSDLVANKVAAAQAFSETLIDNGEPYDQTASESVLDGVTADQTFDEAAQAGTEAATPEPEPEPEPDPDPAPDPNAAPTLTAPDSADTFAEIVSEISGVSVADPDDSRATVTIEASGNAQILADGSGTNATLTDGNGDALADGTRTSTLVIDGTIADVNTTLGTLRGIAEGVAVGDAEDLTITVEDPSGATASTMVTATAQNGIQLSADGTVTDVTDGTDTVTGTSGADLIRASQDADGNGTADDPQLEVGDVLDGGGGTDGLVVSDVDPGTHDLPNLQSATAAQNIEILDITTLDEGVAQTLIIDERNYSYDLTEIRIADGDAVADSVTVVKLGADTVIEATTDLGAIQIDSHEISSANTTVTIALTGGVTVADINDSPSTIDRLKIQSNGDSKNTITDLGTDGRIAAGVDATISGSAPFEIDFGGADFDTVDGSSATGSLTLDATDTLGNYDSLRLIGGSASDHLIATDAEGTTLDGNAGDDTLDGSPNADTISGDEGDDTLNGGDGDDDLDGGAGADSYDVGKGTDTVILQTGDSGSDNGSRDTITGLTAGDQIDLSDFGDLATRFGLANGDTLATTTGALPSDSNLDIYVDRDTNRLVIETLDDGSTVKTDEVNIGFAANANITSDGDGMVTFGTVPLSAALDNRTVMLSGENPTSDSAVQIDVSAVPATLSVDGGSTTTRIGDQAALNIDASGYASANAGTKLLGSDGINTITGSRESDIIRGNHGEDVLSGAEGSDEFRYVDSKDFGDMLDDFESGKDKLILDAGRAGATGSTNTTATVG